MMSPSAGPDGGSLPGFEALEEAIRRALRQVEVWRRRAQTADADRRQLRALLEQTHSGEGDPLATARELARLNDENGELRTRLAEARARVERIEKHLTFLEDVRS
jgi:predicted RNase H-like nuclease (RuvC/YqgF family)